MTKRAICLGGGGPAAGLHIGALEQLKGKHTINFDVWALSCIGAWVGVIYNQAKTGEELATLSRFFRDVFREDRSFQSFPTNTVFTPDWVGNVEAMLNFLWEPKHYRNAFLPREIMKSFSRTMSALRGMRRDDFEFSEGDFNRWTLNEVLAVHPLVRYLTAMMYKSEITGLSRLHYEDSKFLNAIDFAKLRADKAPYIMYNAWNLSKKELQLFSNKTSANYEYKEISAASLCACSALPYIEQTVTIDGDAYCEGALRDTVNFHQLLEDYDSPDDPLDEIWISRIVDAQQIRKPLNVHDALANLCQLFAATVGEDDVRLFKYHVREAARQAETKKEEASNDRKKKAFNGIIVEIKVDSKINFKWDRENLEKGIKRGRVMAEAAWKLYEHVKPKWERRRKLLMVPDDIPVGEIEEVLKEHIPAEHYEHARTAMLAGHRDIRGDKKQERKITAALGPPAPL